MGVRKANVIWVLVMLVATSFGGESLASWEQLRGQLLQALGQGKNDEVLDLIPLMHPFDTPQAAKFIIKYLLPHDDLLIHEESFHVLARLKNREAQKVVIDTALEHKHWEMRASCVRAIATFPGEYPFLKIEEALADKKWQVRTTAIRALGIKRRRSSIPILIERLKEESGRVRQDLVWSLGQLTGLKYDPVYEDWSNWWTVYGDEFTMPTLKEVKAKLDDDGSKKLKTAVAEGLYGRIYSEKIAFLFDVSGSMTASTDMQGSRAEIAYKQLIRVLENDLTPKTYFNIIAFAEAVIPFKNRLTKNKPATVKKAGSWLRGLPVGGETNVYGALKAAFSDPDVDTIILLSDGVPTVGDESIPELILTKVAEWNRARKIIINCIGFFPGDAKNQDKAEARTFLMKLARKNEGYYLEIY